MILRRRGASVSVTRKWLLVCRSQKCLEVLQSLVKITFDRIWQVTSGYWYNCMFFCSCAKKIELRSTFCFVRLNSHRLRSKRNSNLRKLSSAWRNLTNCSAYSLIIVNSIGPDFGKLLKNMIKMPASRIWKDGWNKLTLASFQIMLNLKIVFMTPRYGVWLKGPWKGLHCRDLWTKIPPLGAILAKLWVMI